MPNLSYKPFSKKLYKENDAKTKEAVTNFVMQIFPNWLLMNADESYKDFDLQFVDKTDNKIINIEAERKKVWTKSGEWQGWDTIDIPHRKIYSKAEWFIMFNISFDTLAMCRMKDIHQSQIYYKDTIYTKREPFFSVSLDKFEFYVNTNKKWKRKV